MNRDALGSLDDICCSGVTKVTAHKGTKGSTDDTVYSGVTGCTG